MSSDQLVLMAGLPHAGKTTYLALLYLSMLEGKRSELRLDEYVGDREYLNTISQQLIRCEEMMRTEASTTQRLRLELKHQADSVLLEIPDLSGETWDGLVAEREIDAAVDQQTRDAIGICVFVHVGELVEDPTIASMNAGLAAIGEQPLDADPTAKPMTQVQLVDLIQYVAERLERRPRRLSLVLSAFDLAEGETPLSWLRACAPMLSQYIEMNSSWLDSSVFGVSAQGGKFVGESKAALEEQDTVGRAVVVDGDGSPVSIDWPILRALGRV